MTTTAIETTPKYRDLVTWARSHGAIITSSLLFPSEPYGHCRTAVSITPGTQLLHIPHKLIITPAVATTALPQLRDAPVHERLCAFLGAERRKEGFWKEYLRSLPRRFRTPGYFEGDALEVFKGTNLAFAWRDKVAVWETEYKHAKNVLPELEWKDYLWGATVLSSRSFPLRLLNPLANASPGVSASTYIALSGDIPSETQSTPPLSGDSNSDPILIPVMDMLNHRPNHPVTWLTSSNSIAFVAETEYSPDAEIFNNYGPKGNEELLMGYGFCLEDNPHDSISLKLPYPFDDTLYTITWKDLVPENLIQTFCNAQYPSAREILSKREPKTRRRRYLGYYALYNALCHKLVALGVGRDMKFASMATKFAEIYRQGQQNLYMASMQRLVGLMDEMAKDRIISARDALRKVKRKRRKLDTDERMKRWLAIQVHKLSELGKGLAGSIPDDDEGDGNLSVEQMEYLKKLFNLVYSGMTGRESELEDDEDIIEIYEELTRNRLAVNIDDVARASVLWEEESTAIYRFPDIKEVYAAAHDGNVQGPVGITALEGEEIDRVIFIDDEIEST